MNGSAALSHGRIHPGPCVCPHRSRSCSNHLVLLPGTSLRGRNHQRFFLKTILIRATPLVSLRYHVAALPRGIAAPAPRQGAYHPSPSLISRPGTACCILADYITYEVFIPKSLTVSKKSNALKEIISQTD